MIKCSFRQTVFIILLSGLNLIFSFPRAYYVVQKRNGIYTVYRVLAVGEDVSIAQVLGRIEYNNFHAFPIHNNELCETCVASIPHKDFPSTKYPKLCSFHFLTK